MGRWVERAEGMVGYGVDKLGKKRGESLM